MAKSAQKDNLDLQQEQYRPNQAIKQVHSDTQNFPEAQPDTIEAAAQPDSKKPSALSPLAPEFQPIKQTKTLRRKKRSKRKSARERQERELQNRELQNKELRQREPQSLRATITTSHKIPNTAGPSHGHPSKLSSPKSQFQPRSHPIPQLKNLLVAPRVECI
ncbi:hypothetical protein MMC12_003755 [Toensbergia leucococca]|nr:hypothetical protein [Toensbergia leucococca]